LETAGWVAKDADGKRGATEAARALRDGVEALFAADLPEWSRRLWALAASRAEAPMDGPVHRALARIDREKCVPLSHRHLALRDAPVPIMTDMTESAPHAVAMTLAAVMPREGDRVKADLHFHSRFSDGFYWPGELVPRLVASGVQLAALTDHDTLEGVPEFLLAAHQAEIYGVPGVEIDFVDPDFGFRSELLGYSPGGQYAATYIRSGNLPRARLIAKRCPQL
jgi:hypothetical protein